MQKVDVTRKRLSNKGTYSWPGQRPEAAEDKGTVLIQRRVCSSAAGPLITPSRWRAVGAAAEPAENRAVWGRGQRGLGKVPRVMGAGGRDGARGLRSEPDGPPSRRVCGGLLARSALAVLCLGPRSSAFRRTPAARMNEPAVWSQSPGCLASFQEREGKARLPGSPSAILLASHHHRSPPRLGSGCVSRFVRELGWLLC